MNFITNVHDINEVRKALQSILERLPAASYVWTGTKPGATDDITKGWQVGSRIVVGANTPGGASDPHNTIYECTQNTAGGAVWQQIVSTNPISGGVAAPGDLDTANDYVAVADVSGGRTAQVTLQDLAEAVIADGTLAPGSATYLVQTASADLANERVLGDGEGTSPDYSTSGQARIDLRNKFCSLPFFALAMPVAIT